MNQILDFTETKGLVSCTDYSGTINNSEVLYISEAQKLGVSQVLFRRFYREQEQIPYKSEPTVCIFIKQNSFLNSPEHIKLHAALWSAGRNDIYIIKCPSRVDIINARKPATIGTNGILTIENLILASSTAINGINEQQFSAYLFCNGTFWDQPEFEKKIDEKSSPYIFLLDYLMTVRKKIFDTAELVLLPETIDKLLVTSILIKFLEEITDDKGKHTLRSLYKKHKIQSFAEAVEEGYCVPVLNDLANEFNGKIFDKFSDEEKDQINLSDLKLIAKFLRANIDLNTQQLFIWEQYSFKHLPAEVISAIYENFIQAEALRINGEKEKGVVYTPIHLVNLLIDEVMPLNRPEMFANKSFKILDPACGSGVFLVAAFKRLLQWWAINNSSPESILYPDSKEAQKILEDNIFGVDVKRTATLVSVFSLTTALLDKLTPQEIWNKLKFKDLSQKNIQHDSFFNWAITAKAEEKSFDLVLGNPPFNVESGKKSKDVLNVDLLKKLDLKHKKIPDNNFALHFFEGAMLLSKKVCLIIPANVLLYNKAAQLYRNQIFTNYSISKIFDFTHLRRDLFRGLADTPVTALIATNKPSEHEPIEHIIVKRCVSSEKKIRFEIDYYDNNLVRWDWAIDENKNFIWKTNLLGGGRLFHLIYRLNTLQNLGAYIDEKKKKNDWRFNIGYIIGNDNQPNKASYITNQDSIISINENGEIKTELETSEYFEATRDEELFKPPFLLLKDVLGVESIPAFLIEGYKKKYLTFKRKYTGISAPIKDLDSLKIIFDFIKKKYAKLYQLHVVCNSASVIVKQETYLNKEDIESLPFDLSMEEYMSLSKNEEMIQSDVLTYYLHLGKSINKKGSGSILHKKVSLDQIKVFGMTFCETLNEIYSKNGKSWQQGSILMTELFTITQFGFGNNSGPSYNFGNMDDDAIKSLVEDKLSNGGAIYTRIVRIYQHIDGYDCVFFVKPNSQRYWLNSIALRDADDTFVDLKMAGF